MKYINKLQKNEKIYKDALESYNNGLRSILEYLSLDKFKEDEYVNKNDIFLRIGEIEEKVWDGLINLER